MGALHTFSQFARKRGKSPMVFFLKCICHRSWFVCLSNRKSWRVIAKKRELQRCIDDITIYNMKRKLSRCVSLNCFACICVIKSPKICSLYEKGLLQAGPTIFNVSVITAGMSSAKCIVITCTIVDIVNVVVSL
jgi:hypothetical protein